MRAVLDTNIVIDLLHFADPQTLALQQAIARGTLHCFTDRPCLAELQRVCTYPQFGLDAAAQGVLLDGYASFVTHCEPDAVEDYPLPRCRDADDQKFLILGMRCRADLLITRDRRLLQLARQRRLPLPFVIVTASAASGLIAESPTAAIA
jgi:putative PIN family toxin of toxin-antitoxin system